MLDDSRISDRDMPSASFALEKFDFEASRRRPLAVTGRHGGTGRSIASHRSKAGNWNMISPKVPVLFILACLRILYAR